MPSPDTFSVPVIGAFVQRYLLQSKRSIDPFARNKRWATLTNDINPNTAAEFHMDAVDFLDEMNRRGERCDLAIFDPPYSPRQIAECYKEIGLSVGMKDTQNAALYSAVKDSVANLMDEDSIVLSFGWNSAGMGEGRGFEPIEIMLVWHGGAHNDTICMAERKIKKLQQDLL